MEGSDNWQIHVLATDQNLVTEFIGEINFATSLSTSHKWPHGLLARQNNYIKTRNSILKPPDFIIIAGIPTEAETNILQSSYYLPWGTAPDLAIFSKKLPLEAKIHAYETRRTAFENSAFSIIQK